MNEHEATMSTSSEISTTAARLGEDSQPSPKRRKNSTSLSRENGYNKKKEQANSNHTDTAQVAATISLPADNSNVVSSSTATTMTTRSAAAAVALAREASESTASSEVTPMSISGTEAKCPTVNGTLQTDGNANEGIVDFESTNEEPGNRTPSTAEKRNQFRRAFRRTHVTQWLAGSMEERKNKVYNESSTQVIKLKNLFPIAFYSILFYSILFYSILFYSILFYSILFYSILFYTLLVYLSIYMYLFIYLFIVLFIYQFLYFIQWFSYLSLHSTPLPMQRPPILAMEFHLHVSIHSFTYRYVSIGIDYIVIYNL